MGIMTIPAKTTRKGAIVSAGSDRNPIFPATKFTAHTITSNAMDAAITTRSGAVPLADSILKASGQPLFSKRELLYPVELHLVADSRPGRYANRPLRRDCHFRFDNVFMPVAFAGCDVSR